MSKNYSLQTKQKITVIIIAYDSYCDVWPYFEDFFLESDICDFSHVFVSISKLGPKRLNPILSNNKTASSRIKAAINSIDSDYYLILLEDYLLNDRFVKDKINKYINFLKFVNGKYLCITNFISRLTGKKVKSGKYRSFRKLGKDRNYRLSLQPSIWSKELISKVVEHDIETLWDFENYLNHNEEFNEIEAYFPETDRIKIINMIDKGKITRKALKEIRAKNLVLPQREKKGMIDTIKTKTKNFVISLIPDKILHRILNRKLKKNKEEKRPSL